MKWFKHDCDMCMDLKIQALIEKHGLEGYALWNLCLEMVGREGKAGRIGSKLSWQQGLLKITGWANNGKFNGIMDSMAELNLICPKAYKYGNLSIPKFTKRADDYTMRKLRTESEQSTEKVFLEENRIDKKRIEQIIELLVSRKGWDKNNKLLRNSIYKRNCKPAKELLLLINNDDYAKRAVNWVADICRNKGLGWSLETVIKWLPEFMKQYPQPDNTPQFIKDLTKGIGNMPEKQKG